MIVPAWLLGQEWELLFIYDQLHKLGTIAGIHLFSQGVQVRLLLLLLLAQVLKARNEHCLTLNFHGQPGYNLCSSAGQQPCSLCVQRPLFAGRWVRGSIVQ